MTDLCRVSIEELQHDRDTKEIEQWEITLALEAMLDDKEAMIDFAVNDEDIMESVAGLGNYEFPRFGSDLDPYVKQRLFEIALNIGKALQAKALEQVHKEL